MGIYRKKPVEVEAVQFAGYNFSAVAIFTGFHIARDAPTCEIQNFQRAGSYAVWDDPEIVAEVWDKLHSTWVGVKINQWIIRGIDGEFYPCDDDVFKRSYDRVEVSPYCSRCTKSRHGLYPHYHHETNEHDSWLVQVNVPNL